MNYLKNRIEYEEFDITKASKQFILRVKDLDTTSNREDFYTAKDIIELFVTKNIPLDELSDISGFKLMRWLIDIENNSLFDLSELRGKFLLLSHIDQVIVFKRLFYL